MQLLLVVLFWYFVGAAAVHIYCFVSVEIWFYEYLILWIEVVVAEIKNKAESIEGKCDKISFQCSDCITWRSQYKNKTVNLVAVSFISFTWCTGKEETKRNETDEKYKQKKRNEQLLFCVFTWAMFKTTRRTEIYAFDWGKPNKNDTMERKSVTLFEGMFKINNNIRFSFFFQLFSLVIYSTQTKPDRYINELFQTEKSIDRIENPNNKKHTNAKPKINWPNVRVLNFNFH